MKVSLKNLILAVAVLSIVLTLLSGMISGYQIHRNTLIETTLEANKVYAQKLANITESYLSLTIQNLKESAKHIAIDHDFNSIQVMQQEVDRLRNQSASFNSVVITSSEGIVLATSPETLELVGKKLESAAAKTALSEKSPQISPPYKGITDRLIIFISHPIFNATNQYLGLIGGTIYLEEQNILNTILGEHFYSDGSYVFVVDEEGRIIYHQFPERVNDIVTANAVVRQLMEGQSGAERITNTKNIDMLAGYAYIPSIKWGVVSQRPTEMALAPAGKMVRDMFLISLPLLLLSLIIVWQMAKHIALPLHSLAHYTETSTDNSQVEKINEVRTWYYEAIQLKSALANSIEYFHNRVNHFFQQSTTDPLTNLTNRRTMDAYMKKWTEAQAPYSILLFDIDRFKRVNDTYGHAVGDEVLKYLAEKMTTITRQQDVCCRYGGEEFVILLPETDLDTAYRIGERLRETLETTVSPCGEIVTISIGVAAFPECAVHPAALIEKADQSLYVAKQTGRNKSIKCNV